MSELKTRFIDDTYAEYYNTGKHELAQIYLKSDADKLIAELEERIADGDKDFEMANHQNERLLKIVRHHKYKRCLDEAEICRLEQERIELIECQDITDDDFDKLAKGFYKKWRQRWLELAEKFKPNNSTAQ